MYKFRDWDKMGNGGCNQPNPEKSGKVSSLLDCFLTSYRNSQKGGKGLLVPIVVWIQLGQSAKMLGEDHLGPLVAALADQIKHLKEICLLRTTGIFFFLVFASWKLIVLGSIKQISDSFEQWESLLRKISNELTKTEREIEDLRTFLSQDEKNAKDLEVMPPNSHILTTRVISPNHNSGWRSWWCGSPTAWTL